MKRLLFFIFLILPWARLLPAAEAPASREEWVRAALRDNPSLHAARARWEMQKQRVPQARAWDDPMAGVDLQRMGTRRLDRVTDAEWMISQTLPVSGKNLSRARAAEAEALAAFQELRRVQLDVAMRTGSAYDRLAGAYGQREINQRNQTLLEQFAELSRKKYEVGTATQSDVLMAETELARLAESTAMIERDLSDQQTQLNILANRPAKCPVPQPAALAFRAPVFPAAQAEALAAKQRPEILQAWRKIEAGQARLQLARREWIPDPQVRIAARQFSGEAGIREYDTGIFFSLPWVNAKKYSAGVAEARAGVAEAQASYDAARVEATGLVRDQLKKIETFASTYRLYHERIFPIAQSAVESTRAGYETDKNSFLELLTTRRNAQEVEAAALRQLTEHQVAVAELEALAGFSSIPLQSDNQPAKRLIK